MTSSLATEGRVGLIRGSTPKAVLNPSIVDASLLLGLTVLGFLGFGQVYGGGEYLVVGMVGTALGIAVAELSVRLRQPVLADAVVAIVLFLLLGGVTTSAHGALGGIVPSLSSISALGHASVLGWKTLLTTAPPIGTASNLMAIPYVVGLVAGVGGHSLARRTRVAALPVVAPILVLALGILFGARHPASLFLQGTVFALGALSWTVVRFHRNREVLAGQRFGTTRLVLSGAVLAVTAAGASTVGEHLPGAGSRHRLVLSKYVTPPFDANIEPSPLAGFRQYVRKGQFYSKPLFYVRGLPVGSHVRIATMDAYDGIAWGFASSGGTIGSAGPSDDVFRSYGSNIDTEAAGRQERFQVSVRSLGSVWLPEVGALSRITFGGPRSAQLTTNFRYDLATETAAEPSGLQPGDSYVAESVVGKPVSRVALRSATAGGATVALSDVPPIIQTDAQQWSAQETSPYAAVMAIANHLLHVGYFSDGLGNPMYSRAGHGAGRLETFLQGDQLVGSEIVGDGEQYAAAFALMANEIGVPARVVLGATVPPGGVVRGVDVEPWVEIDLAGIGWYPIYISQFMSHRKPQPTPPQPRPNSSTLAPVQPPVNSALHGPPPPPLLGSNSSAASHFAREPGPPPQGIPLWAIVTVAVLGGVLLLIAAPATAVVSLKARRRRRRRRLGTPATQVAAAWTELLDLCVDMGRPVRLNLTRREQALALGHVDLPTLAHAGDECVFGPGNPSDRVVGLYWEGVDSIRAQMLLAAKRTVRWRARVSTRSLRGRSS